MASKIKVINLVGARPQFIKASAFSRALNARSSEFEEVIVHSGQHYDENMSDVFFSELGIDPPKYHLSIGSGKHGAQTGLILKRFEEVLESEKPDVVVVYGDTNTTIAGALAAAKLNIPVAHVEAGLRSFNSEMPEEINRKMTDHMSTWLFCPTDTAVKLLRDEGISHHNKDNTPNRPYVVNTGDIMLDVALWTSKTNQVKVDLPEKPYVLFTLHRNFNTDNPERLRNILDAIIELGQTTKVVFPMHPRTAKAIPPNLMEELKDSGCKVLDPLSYMTLMSYVKGASIVITDSGGLQKEAYFFEKPVIIPRPETEWTGMISVGCAKTVDDDGDLLVSTVQQWIENPPKEFPELYGKGESAVTMVDIIARHFKK